MTQSRGQRRDSPAVQASVDATCDAFEEAWLAGHQPRIEDFLSLADSIDRHDLLRELLLSEWDLLRLNGRNTELLSYQERFREFEPFIAQWWLSWIRMQSQRTADTRPGLATSEPIECGSILVGRYIVTETLGTGGMGEVYRAFDSQLDRDVALKVLSVVSRSDAQMQERFSHEIKAVAALSHPNIVTLHDILRHDDCTFAVMELVEGKTLRQLISDGISWPIAGQIACAVAEGLNAAHAKSIIHRDIKPENVMVSTSGRVKILDFGLARTGYQPSEQLAGTGFVLGTIPYMSPEQAAGKELTSATDVFSLGIVLFEMITGTNPFRAQSETVTLRNIMAMALPSIAARNGNVPTEIQVLLAAMLSKRPELRPRASEVAHRLRPFQAGSETTIGDLPTIRSKSVDPASILTKAAPVSGPPTVAVLPFQNLSEDPRYRLFGDAVAQEIIVDLCKLHSLFVIARGSSFQFRYPSIDIYEVSQVLGARYLVTGTIELTGNQSVVGVELSHMPDRRAVWAEQFEGDVRDLPALRRTISARLAVEIEARIQTAEVERAFRVSSDNLDAWSAYHRGLWHMYRFNRHDNGIAAQMFQHALGKDPQFARAYAGLSFTCFQEALLGYSADITERSDSARRYAEKSLELDPHDPFAYLSMGRSAWLVDHLDDAAHWLDRSLELSPNYAFALYNRALIDNLLNNGSAGEQRCTKAITLSPIDPLKYAFFACRALSHVVRGDYSSAVTWADKAIKEPNAHVHIYSLAAICNELDGNHHLAKEQADRVLQLDPGYSHQAFLRSFQFSDPQTRTAVQAAFRRIGL